MSKKLTKKDMFAQIKANYALTADEIAFIDHEIELLSKKTTKSKGADENAEYKALILDFLADGKPHTCTEIRKGIPEFADTDKFNQSKMTSLMTALKNDGSVVRTEIKGRAHFALADGE